METDCRIADRMDSCFFGFPLSNGFVLQFGNKQTWNNSSPYVLDLIRSVGLDEQINSFLGLNTGPKL